MDLHNTHVAFVGVLWACGRVLICGLSSKMYVSYFIYSDLGAALEPHMNYNTHISSAI